jgi:type III pantothenate kinase
MKLLVDIGNSCIKWATLDENGLSDGAYFQRPKTSIKAALNKAWKAYENIEAIFVANVAGEKLATQLTEWAEKQWQVTPQFVQSEQKRFGVSNAYDEPESLGVDRWLSLISARQHARQAQCVIDCGTAITIDIVTRNGQHQGGMILPGLTLMRRSLATDTHALTEELDEQAVKTLATNTASAIQVGTLYSVSASLNQIIDDLTQSFNKQIRFIITGGDAKQILPMLPDNVYHYPDIVLKGLAFYARQASQTAQTNNESETEAPILDEVENPSIQEDPSETIENNESVAEVIEAPQTESEPAEEKPKRRRTRKKKVEEQEAVNEDTDATSLPDADI